MLSLLCDGCTAVYGAFALLLVPLVLFEADLKVLTELLLDLAWCELDWLVLPDPFLLLLLLLPLPLTPTLGPPEVFYLWLLLPRS